MINAKRKKKKNSDTENKATNPEQIKKKLPINTLKNRSFNN